MASFEMFKIIDRNGPQPLQNRDSQSHLWKLNVYQNVLLGIKYDCFPNSEKKILFTHLSPSAPSVIYVWEAWGTLSWIYAKLFLAHCNMNKASSTASLAYCLHNFMTRFCAIFLQICVCAIIVFPKYDIKCSGQSVCRRTPRTTFRQVGWICL